MSGGQRIQNKEVRQYIDRAAMLGWDFDGFTGGATCDSASVGQPKFGSFPIRRLTGAA